MTDEQKYNELLKELAALIKEKNSTIAFQAYQIKDLREKLESAKREIASFERSENK